MSLNGKIVFITGASSGIGAATALAFAAEGARLLLAARRAGRLAEVASQAKERGAPSVHSIDLDVRDHRAVQNAIDNLPPEWSEIDILVNNAGLSRGLDKVYMGKIEDWDEMIDTNVKGLLYVTRPRPRYQSRLYRRRTRLPQRRGLLRNQGGGAPD
jgi:NADP-dependent 3-hydroxy acid dehydrogenase YdfG